MNAARFPSTSPEYLAAVTRLVAGTGVRAELRGSSLGLAWTRGTGAHPDVRAALTALATEERRARAVAATSAAAASYAERLAQDQRKLSALLPRPVLVRA